MTVFMSTHTLAMAEEMADRVGIMVRGQLQFLGTVMELREQVALESHVASSSSTSSSPRPRAEPGCMNAAGRADWPPQPVRDSLLARKRRPGCSSGCGPPWSGETAPVDGDRLRLRLSLVVLLSGLFWAALYGLFHEASPFSMRCTPR